MLKQKVISLVKKIPAGRVTTYGEIAHALGSSAYRAVGNIIARSGESYIEGGLIPCHRVVRADGMIGGYCGEKSGHNVEKKKKLLEKEGIKFKDNKIVDFEKKIYRF